MAERKRNYMAGRQEQNSQKGYLETCELCNDAPQFTWRVEQLEEEVKSLKKLLMGTLICSIGTLLGVIINMILQILNP
jgi:hypothetical protein